MTEEGCALLGDVSRLAYDRSLPLGISLELTLRCNLRCAHCYNFERGGAAAPPPDELSFGEILRLMDDLRRAGTLFLSFTGGEPMLHPRFWDLLEEAAARHFAVGLLTNGTLLAEEACDRLAALANLWNVSVSFYGARPETHDAVTRVPGSFRKTLDGARRLRGRGVRTLLKFIVMKSNAAETGEMLATADAEGLPAMVDCSITGRHDGTAGSLETRVDPATLDALYRGPLRSLVVRGRRPADPTDDEFKCNCARGNGAVSSTGDVHPCIAVPMKAGNIREQSFGEIWNDSPVFRRIRGLKIPDFKACAPCGLKEWCRHSPALPFLHQGDFTGAEPWMCLEAGIIRKILTEEPP